MCWFYGYETLFSMHCLLFSTGPTIINKFVFLYEFSFYFTINFCFSLLMILKLSGSKLKIKLFLELFFNNISCGFIVMTRSVCKYPDITSGVI